MVGAKFVIAWLPWTTVNESDACGAAFQLTDPAWLPLMVHVPRASKVALLPEIVQIDGVALVKETARPDVDVAEIAVEVPSGCGDREPNETV